VYFVPHCTGKLTPKFEIQRGASSCQKGERTQAIRRAVEPTRVSSRIKQVGQVNYAEVELVKSG